MFVKVVFYTKEKATVVIQLINTIWRRSSAGQKSFLASTFAMEGTHSPWMLP